MTFELEVVELVLFVETTIDCFCVDELVITLEILVVEEEFPWELTAELHPTTNNAPNRTVNNLPIFIVFSS